MADGYQAWGNWTPITISLASLASDTNLLIGRQSDVLDLTSLGNIRDVQVALKVRTGTTPTADRTILVYCFADFGGDTTYPLNFGAVDAARTLDSSQARDSLKLLDILPVSNGSDKDYAMDALGMAEQYNGYLPKKLGFWVAHNTVANLNGTGSNHVLSYRTLKDVIA